MHVRKLPLLTRARAHAQAKDKVGVAKAPVAPLKLTTMLTPVQLKQTGFMLDTVEQGPDGLLYVYKTGDTAASTPTQSTTMPPTITPTAAKKRKCDEEEEEDNMDEACEISATRLMKLDNALLTQMCEGYGVPTSGSKKQKAERLSIQLHYETDDEEEDD